jgi:autotransporter-associated beta strand protein
MKQFRTTSLAARTFLATLTLGAVVCSASLAHATDYIWNRVGNQSWRNSINWLPNTGYPKVPGDTATFNLNTSEIPGSTNLNETVTISALTVNGAPDTTNFGLVIGPGSSPDFALVFGAVSGNATYVENPHPTPGTGTVRFNAQARFDSNVVAQVASELFFNNTVSGPGSLTINGPGRVVLVGDNSYGEQGGTTVNAGSTLVAANTSGSATGQGPVVVHGTLTGNGSIAGPVTFGGGTLAPAAYLDAPSTLTLGPTVFADSSASAVFRLGLASDFVQVNGDLTLDGSLLVQDAGGLGPGFYPLFGYTGNLVDNGFTVLDGPAGFNYLLDFSQAGLVGLSVAAVPEPATCVLGSFGLVAMVLAARKARRRTSK